MIIEKNSQGWSFSTDEHKNLWHLVFDDNKAIILYCLEVLYTSTQANLFIGTREECDQYILDNNLVAQVFEDPITEAPIIEEEIINQ